MSEVSNEVLFANIKARKDCLEKAEKILSTRDRHDNDNDNDNDNENDYGDCGSFGNGTDSVDSLAELHDSLREILSVSVFPAQTKSDSSGSVFPPPSTSVSFPIEIWMIYYSHQRRQRLGWPKTTTTTTIETTATATGIKEDQNQDDDVVNMDNDKNDNNDMDNRIDIPIDIDPRTARELLDTEADLYRALWLTCLILLSLITHPRDRTRHDNNNNNITIRANNLKREQPNNHRTIAAAATIGAGSSEKTKTLGTTIRQCRLLVSMLEQIRTTSTSTHGDNETIDGNKNNNNNNTEHNYIGSVWDHRIREWTKKNSDDNDNDDDQDDDDSSLNILSFTKEQLEQEEQELLNMASTPIPVVGAHHNYHRHGHHNLNHNHLPKKQKQSHASNGTATQRTTARPQNLQDQEQIKQLWPIDEVVAAQTKARNFVGEFRDGKRVPVRVAQTLTE